MIKSIRRILMMLAAIHYVFVYFYFCYNRISFYKLILSFDPHFAMWLFFQGVVAVLLVCHYFITEVNK